MFGTLVGMFVTGVLFASGPCLFGCGPAVLCYWVGTRPDLRSSIAGYVVFCLARALVYCVLSLAVFLLGELAAQRWLAGAGRYLYPAAGAGLVFLGAMLALGRLQPHAGSRQGCPRDVSHLFWMGCVFAAVPCAPFWALLSYIGLYSRTWIDAGIYTLAFACGTFFSPLLPAVALFPGVAKAWQDKRQAVAVTLNVSSGSILIGLGIGFIRRMF